MHATILAYMFSLVEAGRITVPLGPGPDNVQHVQEFVAALLKNAFGHLSHNQIKITVQGLFNLDQDIPAFKEHLRDFLVQIRVNSFCCLGQQIFYSKIVFFSGYYNSLQFFFNISRSIQGMMIVIYSWKNVS